jgi:CelD/BcsL family acetyltransferase involved in cellulose biosynthesis
MNCLWITDIKEFERLKNEWDKRVAGSADPNPFLLSDFILTWWKYNAAFAELRIFVLYDDGGIAGGLPLYLKRGGADEGFLKVLRHIGGPAANYTEPFCKDADTPLLQELLKALGKMRDWDALRLTHVRPQSPLMAEYGKMPPGEKKFVYTIQDHMNWAIDLSAGYENYMKSISRKLARDLRAKRRHAFERYGELALRSIGGKEEVERYFDMYTDFSVKAFDSRSRVSALADKNYVSFIKEFLVAMDASGRLDAHVLTGGSKVLAISFAYRFGRGFGWILTGFDYEARYVRPGYLLIEEIIKELCRRGETYYNWYGHVRFYKTQWCNSVSPLFQFILTRRTLAGLYYRLLRRTHSSLRRNET